MSNIEEILSKGDGYLLSGTRKAVPWSLYMSSPENLAVLKQAAKDEAEMSGVGVSISNIVEGLLINRYIPENPQARKYIVEMYTVDAEHGRKGVKKVKGKNGIAEALMWLCRDVAIGGVQLDITDAQTLLSYMHTYFLDKKMTRKSWDDEHIEILRMAFEPVITLLENAPEDAFVSRELTLDDAYALRAEFHLDEYPLYDFTSLLVAATPEVKQSIYTYRFLEALLDSAYGIDDTPRDRFEFIDFCNSLFCE